MSKRKNVTLKDDIAKLLEMKAQQLGISESAVIAMSLYEYLVKNS